MVIKAQGKGYENEIFYENIKFHFFGIENIHVMRGSLQKLMDGKYKPIFIANLIINKYIIAFICLLYVNLI